MTRSSTTETALWFAAATGMVSVAVGGLAGSCWTLSGTAVFWTALLVLWWRDSARHSWEVGLVLLFTLFYWGTFLFARDLVQMSDFVLNGLECLQLDKGNVRVLDNHRAALGWRAVLGPNLAIAVDVMILPLREPAESRVTDVGGIEENPLDRN